MTQQGIFELLLQNNSFSNDNKSHIYPTLIPDAADSISAKLTDILYDSLKEKSVTSTSRRRNLLKFIQNISSYNDEHHYVDDTNYSCVLKHLESSYYKIEEVEEFLLKCEQEVQKHKLKLYEKIINVQKARNIRLTELNMQKDFRANRINQKLKSLGFALDVNHKESFCQPNESMIKRIFEVEDETKESEDNDNHAQNENTSKDYRLKQIKFGYAINNIGTDSEKEKYFELIVHNLGNYEELYDFEKSFLKYVMKNIGKIVDHSNLCNKFFFILENDVMEICTQIVKLEDSNEVQQFFHSLPDNEKFIHLKAICQNDKYLFMKIKDILYTLHGHSSCNINKLIKLLS